MKVFTVYSFAKSLACSLFSIPVLLFPFFVSAADYLTGPSLSGLPHGSIYSIVYQTMMWILAILGFLAIIGFVISGILYLTSAGNDNQIKLAKSAMWASIMGVIVALMGYVIIKAVFTWLGGTNPTF